MSAARLFRLVRRLLGAPPVWWVRTYQYFASRLAGMRPRPLDFVYCDLGGSLLEDFASGPDSEFVLFGHADIQFTSRCLPELSRAVARQPNGVLFYWDNAYRDDGWQLDLKPAWNVDLALSRDMAQGAFLVRRTHLFNVLDTSQYAVSRLAQAEAYGLFLRLAFALDASDIIHIPRVLHHYGGVAAARGPDKLPVLQAFLDECGTAVTSAERATVVPEDDVGWRIQWPLPERRPLVSIVIPTRNQGALVTRCIESIIARTDYANYEIVLVDNGSDEVSSLADFARLVERYAVRVLNYPGEFNYAAINNFAVSQAQGDLLCLLNNDTEVISPDWLSEMVSQVLRDGVGAVGAKLFFGDGRVQHGGVVLGLWGGAGHVHRLAPANAVGIGQRLRVVQNYSAVTAACLLLRKATYESCGGMNTDLRVAFNDVDLCLELQSRGLRIVWTPYAKLVHYESATRGVPESSYARERELGEVNWLRRRWGVDHILDPAYHPWLSHETDDGSLAWLPRSTEARSGSFPYLASE